MQHTQHGTPAPTLQNILEYIQLQPEVALQMERGGGGQVELVGEGPKHASGERAPEAIELRCHAELALALVGPCHLKGGGVARDPKKVRDGLGRIITPTHPCFAHFVCSVTRSAALAYIRADAWGRFSQSAPPPNHCNLSQPDKFSHCCHLGQAGLCCPKPEVPRWSSILTSSR